jgi:hypothetical protein
VVLEISPIMSTGVEANVLPQRSLPLMERNTSFYAAFKAAPNKQEQLQQLARALFLFIKVLQTHEADEELKNSKIHEAEESVNSRSSWTMLSYTRI